ncbi:hypothetical protein ACVXZ0_10830 [Staphylococcus aureus]
MPNLNHAQQQTLTDAINAAPTRTRLTTCSNLPTATDYD